MLGCRLDCLNVLSLQALLAFGYVELHLLPFLKAAEAASLNSGEMHEDILPSLTADEAVAFGVVKPLYCSLFHFDVAFWPGDRVRTLSFFDSLSPNPPTTY
jgi:hypothetical protein